MKNELRWHLSGAAIGVLISLGIVGGLLAMPLPLLLRLQPGPPPDPHLWTGSWPVTGELAYSISVDAVRDCEPGELAGAPREGTVRVFVEARGHFDYLPDVEHDGGKPAPVITSPPGGIYYRPGLPSTGRLDLDVSGFGPTPCRVRRRP
jgi:hypothetical protein